MPKKTFEEKLDDLKFYTGAKWLADMWQEQKDNTSIEIKLPRYCKAELKYFFKQEILQVLARVRLMGKAIQIFECSQNKDHTENCDGGCDYKINKNQEGYNRAVRELHRIINEIKKEYV